MRRAQYSNLYPNYAGSGFPHVASPSGASNASTSVVMSPKWILRHPRATSTLEELSQGKFLNVIGDNSIDAAKAKRVVIV